MESPRGQPATPMFRPPVKFSLHRPFEDPVIVRPNDTPVEAFSPYLQYPDVHSTGLPLLLPPPSSFQQHPLGAFRQLYQHQKMRAEAAAVPHASQDEMRSDLHDDSRGEDDDRSRSPDSPTQLTGDEDTVDDVDVDDSTASVNDRHNSSPAASKCESYFILRIFFVRCLRIELWTNSKSISGLNSRPILSRI